MIARCLALAGLLLFSCTGSADEAGKARVDAHGFPLPDGALRRLGDLHRAQPDHIGALAIAPDDRTIATAGLRCIYLWSTDTGRVLRKLDATNPICTLAFSRDGRLLAAGMASGDVMVWHVATGTRHWSAKDRAPELRVAATEVRFIDAGRLLAVAHRQDRMQQWQIASGTLQRVDIGGALSPSGEQMARLQDGRVYIDETATGRLLREVKGLRGPVERVHLLDDGQTLLLQAHATNAVVSAADGGERFTFDYRRLAVVGRSFGAKCYTQVLAVAKDGKSLFTRDEVGIVHWDLATGKKCGEYPCGQTTLALCADGKRMVMAQGCRWRLCDMRLNPLQQNTELTDAPTLHFLRDGRLLATQWPAWHGARTHLWDPRQGKLLESIWRGPTPKGGRSRAPCVWDWWGRNFVYHDDRGLVVHDVVKDRPLCRLSGVRLHDQEVWNVCPALSADGKRVLIATAEKQSVLFRWFDSKTGTELGRYRAAAKGVFPISRHDPLWYSGDGSVFGYIAADGRLTLVDCRRRAVSQVVGIPEPPPPDAASDRRYPTWKFQSTSDEALLLASRPDDAVVGRREFTVWDRATGRMLRRFSLQPNGMMHNYWHAVLAPDGRTLAVIERGSRELTLYETATARLRARMQSPNSFCDVAFAPDGRTLATSCGDSSVLIWDLYQPPTAGARSSRAGNE